LKKNGIKNLKAVTNPTNKKSIRLHLSMGMKMTGLEMTTG
jgi:L-amino acid N-acyltransferase YncA